MREPQDHADKALNGSGAAPNGIAFDRGREDVDLSADELSPEQRKASLFAIESMQFQQGQQASAFSIAAAIAVLLYMTAGIFGGAVLYQSTDKQMDWHTWLIAVSFLLPPTIITVALIRAVYPKQQEKESAVKSLPAADFFRELFRTMKE